MGLISNLYLLRRELGSLTYLRMALSGWLYQNTEPPFIAWFELLVSQARSLASITLDIQCGSFYMDRWNYYGLAPQDPLSGTTCYASLRVGWGANHESIAVGVLCSNTQSQLLTAVIVTPILTAFPPLLSLSWFIFCLLISLPCTFCQLLTA